MEVDLVSHDGGNSRGDFIQTLDLTDVCTGWTETRAVKNKAQVWVFEALQEEREAPFLSWVWIPIMAVSSSMRIWFGSVMKTRSLSPGGDHRKNDNCFVEQKNYSVVRRAVGYWRYDTEEELLVLNQLYDRLRLYTNFFQPVTKLLEKTRVGSKVRKKYDQARTPYRRVLESPFISREAKEELEREYAKLNPVELKREIIRLQDRLSELARLKRGASAEEENFKALEYIFT